METVAFVVGLVLTGAVVLLVFVASPLLRLERQRQAIERERRLAEWRLRAVTSQALRELLHQAREPR